MLRIGRLLVPVIASTLVLAACGSSSNSDTQTGSAGEGTVATAHNAKLGRTVLVDAQGLTLYRLSGERGGHWICTTKSCLAEWQPDTGAPVGIDGLSAVKRPDGTKQVAFHGMPLYTFDEDHKPGDAAGEGVKDVGTWNAVTTKATPAQSRTTTSSNGPSAY